VTADWMTDALVRSFPGVVVEGVTVTDVADGTNSRARVHVWYRSGDGPRRVFIKREGRLLNRLALTALGARETEARLVASGAELPLERPSLFAAATDRRRLAATVVIEDVTLRGAVPSDPTRGLSIEEVRNGLRGLARLHAAYWARPLPGALRFVRPWRLSAIWAPVSLASLVNARRRLRALGAEGIVPAGIETGDLERGFRRWARLAASGPQTLLHGDPHIGNTYTLPGAGVGFLDWQLVRSGSWVHDAGYFLVSSLPTGERRRHERDLIGEYLTELDRAGARAPDVAEAWSQYRRTPVFGLGTWLHTLSGVRLHADASCVAVIERFAAAYADHRCSAH
jgi:phosphotransferase family enzyme